MFRPYRLPKLTGQWKQRVLHLSKHLSQMMIGQCKYKMFTPPPPLPKGSRSRSQAPTFTNIEIEPKIIDVHQVFSAVAIERQIHAIFEYKHKKDRKNQRRHGAPLMRAGRKRSRFLGFGCSDNNESASNSNISDMTPISTTTTTNSKSTSNSSSSYDSDV